MNERIRPDSCSCTLLGGEDVGDVPDGTVHSVLA